MRPLASVSPALNADRIGDQTFELLPETPIVVSDSRLEPVARLFRDDLAIDTGIETLIVSYEACGPRS